jgi:MarR family transcriptional regulator, transcriptional regulator for hemolysin
MHSIQYTCCVETPDPNVGYLINRIARLSQRWLDARLKKFGIAGAAVPVLALLKSGEQLTQRELASRIGIEQPTMAQLLKRMERDGLIVRRANPEDGRSAHISLTDQATRRLPAVRRAMQEGYNLVTESFSERELATLFQLLERYLASVESQLK